MYLLKSFLGRDGIRNKFKWVSDRVGAEVDGVSAEDIFQKIRQEFGDLGIFTYQGGDGTIKTMYNLGQLSGNKCIWMEMYPDSNSGYPWTIAFYEGPCNPTNFGQMSQKFKLRFGS